MEKLLLGLGRIAGGVGVLLVIVAVISRIVGRFHVGSMEVGTVLLGGVAVMLVGCVCLLLVLTMRPRALR